jgi:hypothetical protein
MDQRRARQILTHLRQACPSDPGAPPPRAARQAPTAVMGGVSRETSGRHQTRGLRPRARAGWWRIGLGVDLVGPGGALSSAPSVDGLPIPPGLRARLRRRLAPRGTICANLHAPSWLVRVWSTSAQIECVKIVPASRANSSALFGQCPSRLLQGRRASTIRRWLPLARCWRDE